MKKANEIRYIVTDVVSIPVVRYIYKGDAYAQATKPGYGTVEWHSAEDGYQNPVNRDRNDKTQVLCCDEDCDAVLYPKFGPEFVISPYTEIDTKEIPKQAAVEAILIGDADEWIFWTKDGKIKIFVTYDENGLIDNYRFGFKDDQPYAEETEIGFEDLYLPDESDWEGAYRADIPGTLEYQRKTEQQEQEAGQTASTPSTDETATMATDTDSSLTEEEIKYFEDTVAKVKHSVNVRVPIEIMNHDQLKGKHKEALGICWAKYDSAGNRVPYRITIDEFFVHECFVAIEKPYMKLEPESLEQVIAHEIAHLHYWRHGRKHTELTKHICRLIEKGEPHGMGDDAAPAVSETGAVLMAAMQPTNMKIAENYDQFVERVSEAERTVLNSPIGQELTTKLLKMKLAQNPNMSQEEWAQTKSEFMTFLFAMFIRETPEAMKELGGHIWNEMQAVP